MLTELRTVSAPGVLRPPTAFAWYLPPLPLEQQRQRLHHPPERQILTQTPKQHNDATDTATTISIVSVSSSMSGRRRSTALEVRRFAINSPACLHSSYG